MSSMSLSEIKHKLSQSQHVCLFGGGALFHECIEQIILVLGKPPDYVSDNDQDKWDTSIKGIPVISPKTLFSLPNDVVVIIVVKNYEVISEQLYAGGISNILLLTFGRTYNAVSGFRSLENKQSLLPVKNDFYIQNCGKWALITGASRGVGYQLAISFAKLGINIIAHSRALAHTEKVKKDCIMLGVEVKTIAADLGNSKEIRSLLEVCDNELPAIDILVNCAAVSILPPSANIWEMREADYLTTYAINSVAPIMIANHFIPLMIDRGFGRVINVSSSIQHTPSAMSYSCSKAALNKYVFDISPSLLNTGVLLSVVDPGWLRTDMGGAAAPHVVESVIPGAILGVLLEKYDNGQWFSAQEYAGLDNMAAAQKARFLCENNNNLS